MAYTTVLSDIPEQITAGDSVSWSKSLRDYPAGSGWVLSYILVNSSSKITIIASASGIDHLVEITAAVSAGYAAGKYNWQAYATNEALSERYLVDTGLVEILPDFSQQDTYDGRSHVQKVYENLRSIVEGKASQTDSSYSIGNRSISKMTWEEVMSAYNHFSNLYRTEQRKVAGKSSTVKVKF